MRRAYHDGMSLAEPVESTGDRADEPTRRSAPSPVGKVLTDDGVALSMHQSGPATGPMIVFVHGYPDDSQIWTDVITHLRDWARCVTYDVRGAGASGAPARRSAYRLDRLAADLNDVVETVSPNAPVHLVAHDWGSTQAFHAIGTTLVGRVASFTSISGPHLPHVRSWAGAQLRRGPRGWVRLAGQLASSAYMPWFVLPGPVDLAIRCGILGRLASRDRSRCGTRVARTDLRHGLNLYRANLFVRRGSGRRASAAMIDVPVQVIVPTRDRYVRDSVQSDIGAWVRDLHLQRLDAGHWLMISHPVELAASVRAFVASVAESTPA
jgi:pimeloyl-ACP methyl ester carboxylesterase